VTTARAQREHVRRVVLTAFDAADDASAPAAARVWRVFGPVARGREGVIYEASADDRHVAVKLLHAPALDSTRVAERFEAQRRYCAAMGRWPGLTVAEPLVHLPEQRALVLDWVAAPSVDRVVGLHGLRTGYWAGLLTRAGRWLGAFHRCEWAGARKIASEHELARVDRRLAKHGRGRTIEALDPELGWARKRLGALAEDLGPVPHARLHGDFKPSNLASDADRTVGFDVAGLAVGPVTRDICRFLVHAEIDRRWLRLPRPGRGNPDFDALTIATFMDGYAETGERLDERVVRAGLMAEALLLWITLAARPVRGAARPIRAWRVWRLRHMVRGLADERVAITPPGHAS
jgi:hypothetical protein